jgi:SHS2 domain-containing protein
VDAGQWVPGFGGGRFRIVETTADIGVDGQGPTIEAAQAAAVAGFYHIIAPGARVEERREASVEAQGPDEAVAFGRALQKLVALFDIERFLAASARVETTPGPPAHCTIALRGEVFDPQRHPYGVEVKAVTRHALVFDRAACRVRVVLDI